MLLQGTSLRSSHEQPVSQAGSIMNTKPPKTNKFQIAILCILCICLPAILWRAYTDFDSFVTFVGLFLSWPIAIAVICIIMFTRFHDAIDQYLRTIRIVKLPGGAEIQSKAPTSSTEQDESSQGSITLTTQQQAELQNLFQNLTTTTAQDIHKSFGIQDLS